MLCHSGNAGSIKQVGTVFDLPTQCLTGILNVETKTILYMGFGNGFRFDRQAGKLGFLYMDLLEVKFYLKQRRELFDASIRIERFNQFFKWQILMRQTTFNRLFDTRYEGLETWISRCVGSEDQCIDQKTDQSRCFRSISIGHFTADHDVG